MKSFLLALSCLVLLLPAQALAQTPPPFAEQVAQLQSNPSNDALRHQIIVRAHAMQTPPDIPEDARRALVQGNSAFTNAQTPADFARAQQYFQQAINAAPWWGDAYFNLA